MALLVIAVAFAALLAESAAREARAKDAGADRAERWGEIAAKLRAPFHPKQLAFTSSTSKRRAAKCTRRAGKSVGVLSESLARCLERPRYRALYCHATREEALRIAWRGDNRDGWRDLVDDIGLRVAFTRKAFESDHETDCLVNETSLSIEFRNGSQLLIFCADSAKDADKLRGGQKDLIIVDEAQKFPDLAYFVDEVAMPMLARRSGIDAGEMWMTGTPSRQLAGLFYEATLEQGQGTRKTGKDGKAAWEVHEWTVADNPYFGDTEAARWDATGGAVLIENGWDLDNPPPQFIREWLGKWATGDALYIYAVHAVPPPEFAPVRVDVLTGRYDHAAALADLPTTILDESGRREKIHWLYTMGVDFGFNPDPFAWHLWAWSPQIVEVYEMGCWKRTLLKPDDMRDHLVAVWNQVKDRLVSIHADGGGAMATASISAWEEVIKLPIEPADKHQKPTWMELYNGELYAKRLRYRSGSPLLAEQKHLQWKLQASGKRVEWSDRLVDGVKPGDHVCDAALYSLRDIIGRQVAFPTVPQTAEERDLAFLAKVDKGMSARWRAEQEEGPS